MAGIWRTRFGGRHKASSHKRRTRFGGAAKRTQGRQTADTRHMADKARRWPKWKKVDTRWTNGQASGAGPEHIAASLFNLLREDPTVNCLGKPKFAESK